MATHETQTVMRARIAVGALLASGAMLFVGPVCIAIADPAVDDVTGPTPGEVSLSDQSAMENILLQQIMERQSRMDELLANLMKKESDSSSHIAENMK